MADKKPVKKETIANASGKRKRAIARATAKKGTGIVKINNKPVELIDPITTRLRIQEPVLLAEDLAKNVNIHVNVTGGGWSSQAEASRLAIAKVLIEFTKSAELKKKYLDYDRHLLVADTRYKEAKKPGTHGHARKKRQLSFR
ncbi:30S ribosomal protein S9 [Candidatus Woesearchaeota archaeon]|jgi:small subunit ribosomal protein S9|nr:30S ribosomal protein S9 [Candidatus Woesearchaeota archaeon]MBT4114705.1 30S ribosomal protein S9 [Candidatus Woesearchaeota archaeon]MBT4248161.1 30S ribosomal protein S9 [Candidatus Woesearchaeota archaeon]